MIVEAKHTLKKKMAKPELYYLKRSYGQILKITHKKTTSLTSPAGTGNTDEPSDVLDLDQNPAVFVAVV